MRSRISFITYGEPIDICKNWIADILAQIQAIIIDQFAAQRAAHNAELHKAGGSPLNEEVLALFQGRPLKGAKGKTIFKQLKNKVPGSKFSEATALSHDGYPELAVSLKENIEALLD